GIMAAMAVPSFKSMTARAQARSAAAEIASELRMARQLAMARRERLLVRFDLSEQTITLRRADNEAVLEVYRYADKDIVLDEPSAGVDLYFHPSGRSASAATIVIHDKEDRRFTVTVSLTGRVVIS
ncbi:MAG TPA: GspH/FimT family pseudopilin, partial [Nitrospira sp.]|nr:GspH/FimT family pseudopilin [Nitrospira sp.]